MLCYVMLCYVIVCHTVAYVRFGHLSTRDIFLNDLPYLKFLDAHNVKVIIRYEKTEKLTDFSHFDLLLTDNARLASS